MTPTNKVKLSNVEGLSTPALLHFVNFVAERYKAPLFERRVSGSIPGLADNLCTIFGYERLYNTESDLQLLNMAKSHYQYETPILQVVL